MKFKISSYEKIVRALVLRYYPVKTKVERLKADWKLSS